MPRKYYEDIKQDISATKGNYVDSREYKAHWKHKWVAYCDLIGFANMCLKSNDTTINAIIRFHRTIESAHSSLTNCKVYQFTDAAFCVSDDPFEVLQFALNVCNYSLAHNALIIETKENSLFHHLIVPRVTIAAGDIIILENEIDKHLLSGLNQDQFLAGAAIVNAYKLESRTFAGALAINGADFNVLLESISLRGNRDSIKTSMSRWVEKAKLSLEEKIDQLVEIPWLFLSESNTNGELWTESKSSFLSKIDTLIDISDKMTGDFVSTNGNISLGKHQVGIQRFIFQMLCEIKRQKKFDLNKFRNPRDFIKDIGS